MKHTIRGHPQDRMEERGITKEQVALALDAPDLTYFTPTGSRCFEKSFGGKTLRVWVKWPSTRIDGSVIVKSTAWKGE